MAIPNSISLNDAVDKWLSTRNLAIVGGIISPEVASSLNAEFVEAALCKIITIKGVKLLDSSSSPNGPLENIDPDYFRKPRNVRPQFNMIESASGEQDSAEWRISRNRGERNPDWLEVRLVEPDFSNWLAEESLGDTNGMAIFAELQRWALLPTLAWIATRDIKLTAKFSANEKSFQAAEIRLTLVKAMEAQKKTPVNWPLKDLANAWDNELAQALADGKISSFATNTTRYAAGSGLTFSKTGIQFPPNDQRGSALNYLPDDRNGKVVLVPKGVAFAHSWVELSEVTFKREEVFIIWPKLESVSTDAKPYSVDEAHRYRNSKLPDKPDWDLGTIACWIMQPGDDDFMDSYPPYSQAKRMYGDNDENKREANAIADLWRKLGNGDLTATRIGPNSRVQILPNDWQDVEAPSDGLQDAVRWKRALRKGDIFRYAGVTARREDVKRIWPAPPPSLSFWDFARSAVGDDESKFNKLIIDLYDDFWSGKFAPDGLSLVQNNPNKTNRIERRHLLTRQMLAEVALGEVELRQLGLQEAYNQLQGWNIDNYQAIRDGYRYYFVPEKQTDGALEFKRGLGAPEGLLRKWHESKNPKNELAGSNNIEKQSSSERVEITSEVVGDVFGRLTRHARSKRFKVPSDKKIYECAAAELASDTEAEVEPTIRECARNLNCWPHDVDGQEKLVGRLKKRFNRDSKAS